MHQRRQEAETQPVISDEEISCIAPLSRAGFSPEERPRFTDQRNVMLDDVALLNGGSTAGVQPTPPVLTMGTILQDDTAPPPQPVDPRHSGQRA